MEDEVKMPERKINFECWTLANLKNFLTARQVPISDSKKNILVRNCYAAVMLGLVPKISDEQHLKLVQDNKKQKLILDSGIIHLPNPDSLQAGWEDNLVSFPDLFQDSVENYLNKSKL